jgi:uroporphyrinogen-III synthase
LAALTAGAYEWVTLTSRATVGVLAGVVSPSDLAVRVAAVGEGTAEAFAAWAGRRPDLVPRVFETDALARAFPKGDGRVLCLRADIAPSGLEQAISAKGWSADRVDAYRTVLSRRLPADARVALLRGGVDAVTFTSASTVRGFVRSLAGPPATDPDPVPRFVCIGPVTAHEARAAGIAVAAVANPHTMLGLVDAVGRALAPRGPARRAGRTGTVTTR